MCAAGKRGKKPPPAAALLRPCKQVKRLSDDCDDDSDYQPEPLKGIAAHLLNY